MKASEDQQHKSAKADTSNENDLESRDFSSTDGSSQADVRAQRRHLRDTLRDLERRAVDLPLVGKFHTPDTHDSVYYAGIAALIAFGIVEWPIALAVVGGHLLVKQHHSQTLSAVGEVLEDFWR